MRIIHYVINLDRSTARLDAITRDMAAVGVELTRVPAVDGRAVPEADRVELDEPGFRARHGKRPMAGEYGCYVSHLKAIDWFLASDADFAVIFEDDIVPKDSLPAAVAALAARNDWDVARLAHHRRPPLVATRDAAGHALGTAIFGPSGSSAAYMLRRSAAVKLRAGLLPMRLPYDVSLERGWALGLRVRDVAPDLVLFNQQTNASLTMEAGGYSARKLATWRRLPTLGFRTLDLLRRFAYAAGSALR